MDKAVTWPLFSRNGRHFIETAPPPATPPAPPPPSSRGFSRPPSEVYGGGRMAAVPPTPPASSSCCSPRCRRENSSLLAALAGALSLACLMSAVMTDMWTYTEEGISPPDLSRAAKKQNFDGSVPDHSSASLTGGRSDQPVVKISFTVGLWRVCHSIVDDDVIEGKTSLHHQ